MFKVGSHIEVDGHPHRTDPNACYTEDFKLGDAPKMNRNDQFQTKALDTSKRPLRTADGQPNISGDWAVEQLVLTVGLDRQGKVKSIDVIQSSGHKVLDDAAIRIVRLAEPFPALPDSKEHVDELYISRTWQFLAGESGDSLQTR
jgi:TonB family protein